MKKSISKTILECLISIVLLFIPFVFANYFITNYYLENNKFFWDYDALMLTALKWISVVIISLVIRKKKQNVILENLEHSKKVFFISLVLFVVFGIFVLPNGYANIYGMISSSIGVFEEWPLALVVTWEQYLNGTFLVTSFMSVAICFFNKNCFSKKIK
jgi:hypothetical protein